MLIGHCTQSKTLFREGLNVDFTIHAEKITSGQQKCRYFITYRATRLPGREKIQGQADVLSWRSYFGVLGHGSQRCFGRASRDLFVPSEASRWDAGRWKGVKMLTPESNNDDMSWHAEKKRSGRVNMKLLRYTQSKRTFRDSQNVDMSIKVSYKSPPQRNIYYIS